MTNSVPTNSVPSDNLMPRGAIPSPRSVLAAATPYRRSPGLAAPASFLMWPPQLSYWGNDQYGDCVSAEEAFAKIATTPYIFISEPTVVAWANQYNYLNGAQLNAVLQTMNTSGLQVNGGTVYDGAYNTVDWTDAATLQSAISSQGPVKLGVAAENFQTDSGTGEVTPGTSGWALYNYPAGLQEDHCVSLCGYGNFGDLMLLFAQQGVAVIPPANMPTGLCYAMFTWNSIGIVDEQSMLNMTEEAWVRNPVTTLSFPTVSQLELKNDGGFVVDIHALYRNQGSVDYTETGNHDNFPIDKTKTMDLADKCTNPAIAQGDIVQLKVWVEAGDDATYGGLFTYDPNGPTQSFTISGSTYNNSIQYNGVG